MTLSKMDSGLWIRSYHAGPEVGPRVVCFPHAGGSASFYLPLSQALSAVVSVQAVQYPGRQDRRSERCIDDINELADRIFEAIGPLDDRPLVFFGHSMGAVLAFEVARRFEVQRNVVVRRLLASGRRAPSRYRDENVHRRDDEGIIAELNALGGTDPRLLHDDELLRLFLPTLRTDYRAIETYRHPQGVRLASPITSIVGTSDPKTSLDEANAWNEHTAADFDLQLFDGGHFYLNDHVSKVAELIAARLC
jgi:surfactin synthase thioesterase subunit